MSSSAEASDLRTSAVSPRTWGWIGALAVPLVLGPPWCWIWSFRGVDAVGQLATLTGLILIMLGGVTSYTDIKWRRIPNWTTYPAILWGLLINAAAALVTSPSMNATLGAVGFGNSIVGLLLLFFIMFLLFSLTGRGAGDVKLAASLGALLGWERGLYALAYSFILSGAVALVWAIWTTGPLLIARALARLVGSKLAPGRVESPKGEEQRLLQSSISLAPYFAGGTLFVLLESSLTEWLSRLRL